jgi:hypothetical protein
VFLFGEPPPGFVETIRQLNATTRLLGDHRTYIARTEPERAELFALDPKIHRWLVLEEPELKGCERLLYIDSDTLFFAPASNLFARYRDADLYAREEPFCVRSVLGPDPSMIDEQGIAELRAGRPGPVPPFNTGVVLFNRKMADAITASLPRYFDYLFRFLSWFHHHPLAQAAAVTSAEVAVSERFLGPAEGQALPYRAKNRWIVDQVALWLALGQFTGLRYADLRPADVWQGGEVQQLSSGGPLPILCHYFGSNTAPFFNLVRQFLSGAR